MKNRRRSFLGLAIALVLAGCGGSGKDCGETSGSEVSQECASRLVPGVRIPDAIGEYDRRAIYASRTEDMLYLQGHYVDSGQVLVLQASKVRTEERLPILYDEEATVDGVEVGFSAQSAFVVIDEIGYQISLDGGLPQEELNERLKRLVGAFVENHD